MDMPTDPGKTTDLATDPKCHDVLLRHRALLARFRKEHHDTLATRLLADNVKPIPFTGENSAPKRKTTKKAKPSLP